MSTNLDSWRGVAGEEHEEDVTSKASAMLRKRNLLVLRSILRPHKKRLKLAVALLFLSTGLWLTTPYLIGLAIDKGVQTGDKGALWLIVGAIVLAMTVEIITWAIFLRVSGRLGQDTVLGLRMRLFRKLQNLSISFYERYTSGRVVSRQTSDIDAFSELLNTGLDQLVTSLLILFGITGILLTLNLRLALVTLISFPLVLGLAYWFRKHSAKAYRAVRNAVALVIVQYNESLGGIRAVQAFRREPRNKEIFEDVNERYKNANLWSMYLAARFGPGVNFLGFTTTAVVLLYGGHLVVHNQLSLGILTSFVLYLGRFFGPMQDLSQFYNVFQAAAAALEKLAGVLEEDLSVAEPVKPVVPPSLDGEVRFDHVTFAYRENAVLHDVDVTVPPGQTVALVGQTGAGKSTLAKLMSRFYDPSEGRITLDGIDLRDMTDETIRKAVVMVTQESFLFSGTVADNIAFGRPGAEKEEIENAAAVIGAHNFINALPEGYDTEVKRRGVRLSSGQRQLIAFARAFLANPTVLILDEATSSLDIPTERLVQHALRTLLADRTAFIIAHRLTTVEIADRVLVVDGGRIVEDGSPADLMDTGGAYGALHEAWLESLAG